jgi:hypothetical protein
MYHAFSDRSNARASRKDHDRFHPRFPLVKEVTAAPEGTMVRVYGRLTRGLGWSGPVGPRVLCFALLLVEALWCPNQLARAQQVAPVVTLRAGGATTLVTNTARGPQAVTVALFEPGPDGVLPDTARPVAALVGPERFVLESGEHQVVRLRLRARLPRGARLRLVTCFLPLGQPVARGPVALKTRLCFNALATLPP